MSSENPQRYIYSNFSKAEAAFGLMWLALASLLSVFLEVIYLGVWIFGVPVPYTIVIAFFFNRVLSNTALLWSKNLAIAGIPLWAWTIGYFLMLMAPNLTGDQLVGSSIRSIVLMFAGLIGGFLPLMKSRMVS
ncbi:hypothetical protein N7326_05090 [Corynebacterium sp. ES2794-CONJ1]|uniref:hypothetical protein n=1 Tax=unclassified Corynebacterium TaxID=2624378 RepID=UPI002169A697|nr:MULTISPECIES: hypothetical protein [unclassified Corynebacterium]MCS4489889.1 hypothetical protein [Corynebacterium sp. ES2775-CONJ]MCS4491747.1 hypothetical protein [Corynebacterium sp. ES2715-CONJ3]MCS4531852.1 hypothetical protein [Corynebacterium sp. ES2730-CONJ]MCU9519249.1 hypothetical protein [Corynebacterium sp. ES2794-CONJ1]